MNSTKNIKQTITDVIGIPRQFKEFENVTFNSLLKETGYFDVYDKISVKVIRDALRADSDRVIDWLQLSEDKRSDAGWYFCRGDKGDYYEVGYFSLKANDIPSVKYSDSTEACAAFIKHEIEKIRLTPI